MERELRLYAFSLWVIERMAADIPEERLGERAGDCGHSAAWILGHLCITADIAAMMLGLPRICPDRWHEAFGPWRVDKNELIPSKAELLDTLRAGHVRVAGAVAAADNTKLDRPHGLPYFANCPLVTVGDAVANLMTVHEGLHMGQLSSWRRRTGLPVLL